MPYQPDVSMVYVVSKPDTSMPYTMQVKLTPVCHVVLVASINVPYRSTDVSVRAGQPDVSMRAGQPDVGMPCMTCRSA